MSRSPVSSRVGRIVSLVVATGVVAPALALSATTSASAQGLPTQPAKTPAQKAAATASYDSTVLADAPQYYYPLSETTGPVRDATGNEPASTVTTAQLGAAGVQGTAASFDGVSQRIQVPYDPDMKLTGSFSIEMWAKLPANPQTTDYPTLLSRGSGAVGRFGENMFIGSDAAHLVSFKRNGKNIPTARGLTSNAYRQLVFTWDAPAQRYTWYVDGTPDISEVTPALAGVDTETAPLNIAARQDTATSSPYSFGKVSIGGLAVYKTVLPAGRVAAHYAAAAPAPPVEAPITRRIGGIAVGDLQTYNPRRAADFAAWNAANATYVRADIGWKYVQPTPTTWSFTRYDQVLTDMNTNNLKYLAILHTVPAWANGGAGDAVPAPNLAQMTEYCYQTVKHFRPAGVVNYEIGNEVNYAQDGWIPTGASYARKVLIPCVTGARRAATELGQPVNLMFGSMAPGAGVGGGQEAVAFLTEAYANGARGLTDSLGFHPYGGLNPSVEPNMVTLPDTIHAVMQANGDGADKIWATEYGLPTGGTTSWSEQVQADWVGAAYDTWAAHSYAGPMIWYAGRDSGTSATDREQHFGILRFDGSAKPAYAALQAHLTR
jgi:hypothetical protein